MLKSVLAAIGRFFAAMPRWALQRVRVGAEWIMKLVAVPSPAYEAGTVPGTVDCSDDEHLAAIRTAAGHIYDGAVPPPSVMAMLSKDDVVWLGTMPKKMHSLVVAASDADLRAHLRGKRMIRGLLNADPAAVADYQKARETARTAPPERREMRPAAA